MKIIEVKNNTLGHSIGLKPGDRLLKINGKRVVDEIDYRFRITDEKICLTLDFNDGNQFGVGLMQLTTNYGKRCSAVDAFIKPIRENKKLNIKFRSIVTKIIIDNGKAIGVEVFEKGKINLCW